MNYLQYTCQIILDNDKPVHEYKHKSIEGAFVEGRKGNSYKIRLKNNSPNRVLMIPSVDGLSVLDGQPSTSDSGGYVLEPFATLDIPGWTLDNQQVAKFVFGTKSSSYAKIGPVEGAEANVGVIGVLVYKEKVKLVNVQKVIHEYIYREPWIRPYYYPHYDRYNYGIGASLNNGQIVASGVSGVSQYSQAIASNSAYSNESNFKPTSALGSSKAKVEETSFTMGTEFGEAAEFKTVTTMFEKDMSSQLMMVIYYDTLANLKKRGVDVTKPDYEAVAPLPKPFAGVGCQPPANWKQAG